MKLCRHLAFVVVVIVLSNGAMPAVASRATHPLSVDERMGYQRMLDTVAWQRTLIPAGSIKPSLAQVIPPEISQRKVEDALRESDALATLWSRPLTPEQLQLEMQRIAQQTKQPELLREQWNVLNDDPYLIAELQVRPLLADRLLRAWFARDERVHGLLKARALAEVAHDSTVAALRQMSGEYAELELTREHGSQAKSDPSMLSPAEWDEQMQWLAQTFGVDPNNLPVERVSALQEDDSRFYVSAILAQSDEHVRIAVMQWPKVPFETWWANARAQFAARIETTTFDYHLPQIGAATCTNDCWSYLSFVPLARAGQAGVWTGTDLIIWGGVLSRPETGGRYNPATDSWHPISNANVPSWRTGHTVVWTGSEMIVWGGWGGSFTDNLFNSGGRYNPVSDTWMTTSIANAPSARQNASAVWTGSEMIVWGGSNASGQLNTGARYNPATDGWTATSVTNAPSPRSGHRTVWTNGEMIVWGGLSGSSEVNTGGRYNPSSDAWVATNIVGAPDPRSVFSSVWTGTEMVVWGGANNSGFTILNTGGRYNPATNSWKPTNTSNAPNAVFSHAAVWTGNLMVVFGGCPNHDCSSTTNAGGRYDPSSDSWMATSGINVPSARNSMTAVWTGSEMIVWGGCISGECQNTTNTGGRYNPSSDSWVATAISVVPFQRDVFVSVWTGTEMLVWGIDSQLMDKWVYRYAPATDSWVKTVVLNAPDARSGFSGVWSGTELIVWGGGVTGFGPSITGGRFNPSTNTWTVTSVTNAPSAREWHSAVWTGSEMIVWGGCLDGSCTTTLNSGARYNPVTDTWTPISTVGAPSGRFTHSAIWTGSEMIVWGGQPATNTGARYNPASDSWTPTNLNGAPSRRWAHAGVWSGSEMIVWGGYDGVNTFNNGARYKPATNSWTAITLAAAPGARWNFPSVWSGSELIVWGGIVNAAWPYVSTNTGGRYNPASNSWTSTTTQSAPSARDLRQSVWTGSQMIVWGGTMDPDSVNTNTGGMYWATSAGGGPPPLPTLFSLILNPTSVISGQTSQGTLTLSSPAPSGGALVTLSSSNGAASVPASMTIPAGAISANFTITTNPVPSATSVTIAGAYNGSNVSALLSVGSSGWPALKSVTLNPTTVRGGSSSTGTVTLSLPAPAGGAVVSLASSNTNVATVPASVTVPAGATSATFTVSTMRVKGSSTTVYISGSYGEWHAANLTVK